ncbi:MAG TPA: alpha-ketoglutarate-dependent dioxygenase AlkB [Wenzhouxiangellaceae bacterium]|nr:alpha-ketoglutarate-dependent dioxygenase AlkB [Wenzhouxiangellaceae bacterium]
MKAKSIPGDVHVKALPPGGELVYIREFIERSRADRMLSALIGESFWRSRTINMFGRQVMQPRKIAFQGDPGVSYVYSGDVHHADPWHEALVALRAEIERQAGCRFNCALLNLYRGGSDSMGWHSDDEAELGSCPTIASISLGAVRRFVLRSKQDRRTKLEISPAHGSLMLMRGDLQHHWQHALPKTALDVQPRINLTFRRIVLCPNPDARRTR